MGYYRPDRENTLRLRGNTLILSTEYQVTSVQFITRGLKREDAEDFWRLAYSNLEDAKY